MRKHYRSIYFILALAFSTPFCYAQTAAEKRIVLRGHININNKNGLPLPYANIRNKSKNTGTVSSTEGLFSLYVNGGDTLNFSAVGFKPSYAVIPLSVKDSSNFSAVYIMLKDTLTLKETTIRGTAKEFELRNNMLQKLPDEPKINPVFEIKPEMRAVKNPICNTPLNNPISYMYDHVYKPIEKRKIKKRSTDGHIPVPLAK